MHVARSSWFPSEERSGFRRPIVSDSFHPNMRTAAGFQTLTVPEASLTTTARGAASIRACRVPLVSWNASSARVRSARWFLMVSSMTSFARTSVEISFSRGTASKSAPEYSRMVWSAFPYRWFKGQAIRKARPAPISAMPARMTSPHWVIRVRFFARSSRMTPMSDSIRRQ